VLTSSFRICYAARAWLLIKSVSKLSGAVKTNSRELTGINRDLTPINPCQVRSLKMAGFGNGYGKCFLDSMPEARYYYITAFEQEVIN
jgi:hypothetical protein